MRRVTLALALSLCAALTAVNAQQASPPPLKKTMADAKLALDAGRLKDALALYDQVLASDAKDKRLYEADALYGVALALLTPDRTPEESERARVALYRLVYAKPAYSRQREVTSMMLMLDEMIAFKRTVAQQTAAAQAADAAAQVQIDTQKAQITALTSRLEALATDVGSSRSETDQLRREVNALRADNRGVREELNKSKADLAKKDAALRKIGGSIVNKPSR